MKISLLPLALTLLALPLAAPAQNAPAQAPATPSAVGAGEAAPTGYVDFNAGQTFFDDNKGVGIYTGDVTATQVGEDFILYAQRVVSSRADNTATANKDLRIETRESTITGTRLFANFNTKVFSITGDVVVNSYGEGDGVAPTAAAKRRAQAGRKPVRITCDRLDWNYDTRQATLVGSILITSGDSVGTCNKIIYDEPKNAAHLIGDVRFGNQKRQQFLTDDLLVFIDSGLIQSKTLVRAIGPVNNLADGATPPAPKVPETFPEPANLDDETELPKPPPDIDTFLPKPGAPGVPKPGAKTPKAAPTAPAAPPTPAPAAPQK